MTFILILAISIFLPLSAFCYDGVVSQEGTCGETEADCYYYLYKDGHLEISGTGEMTNYYPHNGFDAPWSSHVKSVNIEGITSIGEWAFFLEDIEDVQMSDSVKTINHGAFEGISRLKNITIPNSVEEIRACAFCGTGITSLVIPENVSTVSDWIFGGIGSFGENSSIPQTVYCSESIIDQCVTATNWKKELGVSVNVIGYKQDGDKIFYNNKWYSSANDISSDNHIKKRIYTVDEASRVSGTKNSFKIRYK